MKLTGDAYDDDVDDERTSGYGRRRPRNVFKYMQIYDEEPA